MEYSQLNTAINQMKLMIIMFIKETIGNNGKIVFNNNAYFMCGLNGKQYKPSMLEYDNDKLFLTKRNKEKIDILQLSLNELFVLANMVNLFKS